MVPGLFKPNTVCIWFPATCFPYCLWDRQGAKGKEDRSCWAYLLPDDGSLVLWDDALFLMEE